MRRVSGWAAPAPHRAAGRSRSAVCGAETVGAGVSAQPPFKTQARVWIVSRLWIAEGQAQYIVPLALQPLGHCLNDGAVFEHLPKDGAGVRSVCGCRQRARRRGGVERGVQAARGLRAGGLSSPPTHRAHCKKRAGSSRPRPRWCPRPHHRGATSATSTTAPWRLRLAAMRLAVRSGSPEAVANTVKRLPAPPASDPSRDHTARLSSLSPPPMATVMPWADAKLVLRSNALASQTRARPPGVRLLARRPLRFA